MKKILITLCSILVLYFFSNLMIYEIKKSNPYLLKINQEDMVYDNEVYENLYQVSYGKISNIVKIQTKADKSQYIFHTVDLPREETNKFYVGQYIKNSPEFFFAESGTTKNNVRIISKQYDESNNEEITYLCGEKKTVFFALDSDYINKISEKNKMIIYVGNHKLDYSIKSIGNNIHDNKFELEVEINDSKVLTRPGTTINAELVIEKKEKAIIIPTSCITSNDEDEQYVVRYQNGNYEYVKIVTGIQENEMVEIVSGLSEGDIIVVNE